MIAGFLQRSRTVGRNTFLARAYKHKSLETQMAELAKKVLEWEMDARRRAAEVSAALSPPPRVAHPWAARSTIQKARRDRYGLIV